MKLRDYQQKAVSSVVSALERGVSRPLISAPTGSGKSVMIAEIMRLFAAAGGTVICCTPSKELAEQNYRHLCEVAPDLDVGLCSRSLKSMQTDRACTIGTIGSIRNRVDRFGAVHALVIDEAHLLRPDKVGKYQELIELLQQQLASPIKVIGLTATPFRSGHGAIYEDDSSLFEEMCYEIEMDYLIESGYLCPLISKSGTEKSVIKTHGLKQDAGEFVMAQADLRITDEVRESAVSEILEYAKTRSRVLVFCTSIKQCHLVAEEFVRQGESSVSIVTGSIPMADRGSIVRSYREGETKYLINCNVLTTGFDVPELDLIALLRPTESAGLFVQMVGRGSRRSPGKENCLVLDFGENIVRHGPVNKIKAKRPRKGDAGGALLKACPDCGEIVGLSARTCPECGYPFPGNKKPPHEASASNLEIIKHSAKWREVSGVRYLAEGLYVVRVQYVGPGEETDVPVLLREERVFLNEQTGWFADYAQNWWSLRRPDTAPFAVPRAADDFMTWVRQLKWPREVLESQVNASAVTARAFTEPKEG